MADIVSPEKRSAMMAAVRQKHTRPEIAVRSALHRLGYRFTVSAPRNKLLPGRPDIILPRHRALIFVHGCFWHRHRNCRRTTTPAVRLRFWQKKFEENVRRDSASALALKRAGWRVMIVWECETRSASLFAKLAEFVSPKSQHSPIRDREAGKPAPKRNHQRGP
jgi:DNA mismatch endonuclease (patch repair protein)